jgi:hypothetical protein
MLHSPTTVLQTGANSVLIPAIVSLKWTKSPQDLDDKTDNH